MTKDEIAGWYHHSMDKSLSKLQELVMEREDGVLQSMGLQSIGHGFGWTPGVGDGQGGLACCSSWGLKESDMTE